MDPLNQEKCRINRHKALCRHKEKCYRKNPDHLADFSHPHLENILEGQLDVDNPVLPQHVPFQCDRSLVEIQLKILQKVLKKERSSSSSQPVQQVTSPVQRHVPLSLPLLQSPSSALASIDLTLDASDDEEEIGISKKRLPSPASVRESKSKLESSPKRLRQDEISPNHSIRQQTQQDKLQQPSTSHNNVLKSTVIPQSPEIEPKQNVYLQPSTSGRSNYQPSSPLVQNYNAQQSPSIRTLLEMEAEQHDNLQSTKLNNHRADSPAAHQKTLSTCQKKDYDKQKTTLNLQNNLPVPRSPQASGSHQINLQPSPLTARPRQNNIDQQLYKKKLNYQQDLSANKSPQKSTSSHDPPPASASLTPIKKPSHDTSQASTSSTTTTVEKPRVRKTQEQFEKEREKTIKNLNEQGRPWVIKPPGEFDIKYILSEPYNVFLTCVLDEPDTWDQPYSITFPEILDISLGNIVKSLHINFMVHVGWLAVQYLLAMQPVDCTIICEERKDDTPLGSNTKVVIHKAKTKYGCHHSKISILQYENGARIIISTANLYLDDWQNRTQAVWISPHLPYLVDNTDLSFGESRTGFKKDFLEYIKAYELSCLKEWSELLGKLDFTAVDVFFVGSVPGSHKDNDKTKWGVQKLSKILSQHAELPSDGVKWSIVGQCSSIGNLGKTYDSWVGPSFVSLLAKSNDRGIQSVPKFKFIYPTVWNYKQSFDVRYRCCCLPYTEFLHKKQMWLNNYLHSWKSEYKKRTKAMPHVKSYTRISPDGTKIPWITITSANLSKAAWGYGVNSNIILSYEAGIVFIPKFVTGQKTFPIKSNDGDVPPFPIPYDVPLKPYEYEDDIFVNDIFNR